MRPQSSRPTPIPSGAPSTSSHGISPRPADTTRAEVARQLSQAMRAARMPPPESHEQDMRPAELMDAAQQEVLLSQDAIATTRAHARAHAAMAAACRIAGGTYGICQACGKTIPPQRLPPVPLTWFCLTCQDVREQEARGTCAACGRGLCHQHAHIHDEMPLAKSDASTGFAGYYTAYGALKCSDCKLEWKSFRPTY